MSKPLVTFRRSFRPRAVLAVASAVIAVGCFADSGEPTHGVAPSAPFATEVEATRALSDLYASAVARARVQSSPASGLDDGANQLMFERTALGTPRSIVAPGFRVRSSDLGLSPTTRARALADAFVSRFAVLWGVDADAFAAARITERRHPSRAGFAATTVAYAQRHHGVEVAASPLSVVVDESGDEPAVVAVTGSFLPVEGLSVSPAIEEGRAASAVELAAGEHAGRAALVVWSGYRSGGDPTPRLAWRVRVNDEGEAAVRDVYVDASNASVLASMTLGRDSLRRSLWDLRGASGYGSETCQKWQTTCVSYPAELSTCGSQCTACASNPRECALCTCEQPAACGMAADPVGCASAIWRYDETTGCVANGSPAGEPNCGSQALQLWSDMGVAHAYWSTTFGRDSWDGAGGWMWGKVGSTDTGYAGRTQAKWVDNDTTFDLVQVTIKDLAAGPQLDGHEIGHALQYGLMGVGTSYGFYDQGLPIVEGNADVHSFRYRGLSLGQGVLPGAGYRCDAADSVTGALDHFSAYRSANAGQSNKYIAECHDWLLSNSTGSPITQFGITVSPVPQATFDQIWYRALDLYTNSDSTLSESWNAQITAAFDVCGGSYCSTYFSAVAARDAAGGFTPPASMATGITNFRATDRVASVGWAGAPRGPCLFYRSAASTQQIYVTCYGPGGWTSAIPFNSTSVDPAASEPSATFRLEGSTTRYAYVAWRGTDDRIFYRRFDLGTFAIGPAQVLTAAGTTVYTCDAPAIAPIRETSTLDRVVVVYHPRASGTSSCTTAPNPLRTLASTWIGSTVAPTTLTGFDTAAPPSLVGYPYPNRIYLFRPDLPTGATANHVRYASYTLSGWTGLVNLTPTYTADGFLPKDILRTDGGLSLAEYNRSTISPTRLRMTFVTTGANSAGVRERWMGTLRETAAGTLGTDGYRVVPLSSVSASTMQSSGGMAVGPQGYPLWSFWAPGTAIADTLLYGD